VHIYTTCSLVLVEYEYCAQRWLCVCSAGSVVPLFGSLGGGWRSATAVFDRASECHGLFSFPPCEMTQSSPAAGATHINCTDSASRES
jgi:hypothetical protein